MLLATPPTARDDHESVVVAGYRPANSVSAEVIGNV